MNQKPLLLIPLLLFAGCSKKEAKEAERWDFEDLDDQPGLSQQIMKMMGNKDLPDVKPILEINPTHPIVTKLAAVSFSPVLSSSVCGSAKRPLARTRAIGRRSQVDGTWRPGDPELIFGLLAPGE